VNSPAVLHLYRHRLGLDAFQFGKICGEVIGSLTCIDSQETEKGRGTINCVGCILES